VDKLIYSLEDSERELIPELLNLFDELPLVGGFAVHEVSVHLPKRLLERL